MTEPKVARFADAHAEDLFNRLLQAVPDAMKDMVKPMLINMAEQKTGGGPITVEAIKEMVEALPEPQKSVFKQVLSVRKGLDPSLIKSLVQEFGKDIHTIFFKIMEQLGYIPAEALPEIAKETGISHAHLYHLVTTGSAFSLLPLEEQITICTGTSCRVRDKSNTLETIERLVKEARDHRFTLKRVRCLGCCNSGPNAEVKGKKMALEAVKSQLEVSLKG